MQLGSDGLTVGLGDSSELHVRNCPRLVLIPTKALSKGGVARRFVLGSIEGIDHIAGHLESLVERDQYVSAEELLIIEHG